MSCGFISFCAYSNKSQYSSSWSFRLARPFLVSILDALIVVYTTLNDTQRSISDTSTCHAICEARCQILAKEYRMRYTFWKDVMCVALMISVITVIYEVFLLKNRDKPNKLLSRQSSDQETKLRIDSSLAQIK